MNFLAHSYLSFSDENLMVGNLIADFLKAGEESKYPSAVQKGIQLHKKIDAFTDNHSASLQLRNILRPTQGKYASVAVDLVWDYYLSQYWHSYSDKSLRHFADDCYEIILCNQENLPGRLSVRIHRMIDDDFLLAYVNQDRMRKSLLWMDKRTKFPSSFVKVADELNQYQEEIQKLFEVFFPDMIKYVEKQIEL